MDDTETPQSSGLTDWSLLTEPLLQRVSGLAKKLVNAPTAWVFLAQDDSRISLLPGLSPPLASGLGQAEFDYARALCRQMMKRSEPLVIPDLRSVKHSIAPASPNNSILAAYLGVPLKGPGGLAVGALCVVDTAPTDWGDQAIRDLSGLGELVEKGLACGLRQRQAFERANQRLDELLSTIGHDMRSPLSAILSAVQLVRWVGVDEKEIEWSHGVIERQTKQLIRMIDDLLDVSRLATGKLQLRKQMVRLSDIVERAVSVVRPTLERRCHKLLVDLGDESLHLEADPARIEQILVNLLMNAVKFTEQPGKIELKATRSDGSICITVSDSGVGIPENRLSEIFELWPDTSSSDGSQIGHGICLTLVKRLTELHGGRVEVMSEGLGTGSQFTVYLPFLDFPSQDPGDLSQPRSVQELKILVVDDNLDSARSLAMLLEISGYDVQLAYDGDSAIKEAIAMRPRAVILDIGLPGRDGYAVARALRQDPDCRHALIIGVSGYSHAEDRNRSREAGFDAHLVKPVDLDQLLGLLGQIPVDGRSGSQGLASRP